MASPAGLWVGNAQHFLPLYLKLTPQPWLNVISLQNSSPGQIFMSEKSFLLLFWGLQISSERNTFKGYWQFMMCSKSTFSWTDTSNPANVEVFLLSAFPQICRRVSAPQPHQPGVRCSYILGVVINWADRELQRWRECFHVGRKNNFAGREYSNLVVNWKVLARIQRRVNAPVWDVILLPPKSVIQNPGLLQHTVLSHRIVDKC